MSVIGLSGAAKKCSFTYFFACLFILLLSTWFQCSCFGRHVLGRRRSVSKRTGAALTLQIFFSSQNKERRVWRFGGIIWTHIRIAKVPCTSDWFWGWNLSEVSPTSIFAESLIFHASSVSNSFPPSLFVSLVSLPFFFISVLSLSCLSYPAHLCYLCYLL